MLAHNGIRAQTTGTGTEAIETATATEFDAIILDLNLPDMDGRDVLDMIRQSGCNRRTPIVAILSASDRASIPDLHIQGFVEQPVDLHHLGEALWRAGLSHAATSDTPETA
jgi:CheY-like chemotaxis protein